MRSSASNSGFRLPGICLVLLILSIHNTPGQSQDPELDLPEGFVYVGRGMVEGTDQLVLTSPTSAVLLSIVANGTEVLEGDLLAAIDDSRLNTLLARQQTVTKQAADTWKLATEQLQSARKLAALELEIAAQAVRIAKLNREQVLGENGIHEQEVAKATDDRDRTRFELESLTEYLTTLQGSSEKVPQMISQARLKVLTAQSGLRQTAMELQRLRGVRRDHLQAQLDLDVLRAQSNELQVTREQQDLRRTAETHELNRKNVLDSLKNKLKEIEEQIAQCQIFAPHHGIIQHSGPREMAKGAAVRANQPLMVIVSVDTLLVKTFVNEKRIGAVKAGQHAAIRVEAQQLYRGVVEEVSSAPDGPRLLGENTREFMVMIKLKPPHTGLRLGMHAQVGINTGVAPDP